MWHRFSIAAAGALLALLASTAPVTPAPAASGAVAAEAASPTRILIVGDSITQGRGKSGPSGGYSWRYFLWKRFVAAGAQGTVDLVGNKTGPALSMTAASQDPSRYTDPNFDYNHAGVAGATLGEPDPSIGYLSIGTLVHRYQPGIIVALWGTNDLREGRTPAQVIASYTRWLLQARAQNPDVDIVIGRLAWTWMSRDVARLNELLPRFAAAYSTSRSRIVLAQMRDPYSRADTYDDLHPIRRGEEKIASMMASSLQALGLSIQANPILAGNVFAPARRPATPTLRLRRDGSHVVARWSERARATSYTLRCNGVDRTYAHPRVSVTMRNNGAVTCRVRATNLYAGSSEWSPAVRVARRR